MIKKILFILILILINFLIIVIANEEFKNRYLFEKYEYNLEELIKKNDLLKQEQLWGYCFDSNNQIKELAKNLTTIRDIQDWILNFPYDYDQLKNLSTRCQNATTTLAKGKGICSDKSILLCSIFYEKNISCYSVCGTYNGNHCISLIFYNNSWRPILTTGFIDENSINNFMNSLTLIESKTERYFKI